MEHIWTLSQMADWRHLISQPSGKWEREIYTPKGDYTENYPNSFLEIGDKGPQFPLPANKTVVVGSMHRYTLWSNTLTDEQLHTQVYTSHGPTVINPTWFTTRKWFDKLQGFKEVKKGYPEDLEMFYR